jgi:hypothetical protein
MLFGSQAEDVLTFARHSIPAIGFISKADAGRI